MKKNYDMDIEAAGAAAMTTKKGNALFTIFPYKKNSTWMFDDESRGLLMEPFVAGADTLLDKVCGGKHEITAIFSPTEFPDHDFVIEKTGGDESGTDYYCEKYNHKLWLCPALFCYITPAPAKLFVKISK